MKTSIFFCAFWLTCALLLAACEKTSSPTEVLINVDSDLSPGTQLTRVDVELYAADGAGLPLQQASFPLVSDGSKKAVSFPFSFSVIPTGSDKRDFRVVVTGIGSANGSMLAAAVEKQVIAQFRANAQVRVDVFLSQLCFGKLCRDAQGRRGDLTCNAAGTCDMVPTQTSGNETADDASMTSGDASTMDGRVQPVEAGSQEGGADSTLPVLDGATPADGSPSVDGTTDSGGGNVGGDSATECEGGTCTSPCTGSNGAAVCSGATLYQCNSDSTVQGTALCASARQCELGKASKTCAPCSPGAFRCTDTRLEVCADDGFSWQLSKTCTTAALCNATVGDCTDAACTPTTRVCDGDNLKGCNTTQTALVTVEMCSPGLCDQAGKQCDVCVANSKTCSADVRVVCDATGQTFSRSACTSPTPRCIGAAQCVQCTSAGDCSAPASSCQSATCDASGICGVTNKTARIGCSGGVCDGAGNCVQCVINADCNGVPGKPFCSNNVCVQCSAINPCTGAHEACEGGLCVVQPYCGDGRVTSGEQCDPAASGWNVWSCSAGCVETPTYNFLDCANTACPAGLTCSSGVCMRHCDTAAACPMPPLGLLPMCASTFCYARGCSTNSDCAPGLICDSSGGISYCTECYVPNDKCSNGTRCIADTMNGVIGKCQ